MQTISNKERMKIPRQPMPEQDGNIRKSNFGEVNLGFTEELVRNLFVWKDALWALRSVSLFL